MDDEMAKSHHSRGSSSLESFAAERSAVPARPVDVAAVWMHKATKGSDKWVDECSQRHLWFYVLRKKVKPLTLVVKYAYLLLAVFEEPSWCLAESDEAKLCLNKPGVYSWNLHLLPLEVTNTLELACLLYFVLTFWLRSRSGDGPFRRWWHLAQKCLVSLALADCAVGTVYRAGLVPGIFRVSRLCRPLIYISSRNFLRSTISRLCKAFLDFWEVLAALAALVVIFAWMGMIIFSRSSEGGWDRDRERQEYFVSCPEALASLWILFTTANFPDVMIDVYTDARLAFLFFLLYLLVSLYLLNNILLAAAYDAYKVQLVRQLQKFQKLKARSIGKAFHIIASSDSKTPYVDRERWTEFVIAYYGLFRRVRGQRDRQFLQEKAETAFEHMDVDSSGRISEEEFRSVLHVLSDPSVYIPTRPFPRLAETCWGRRLQRLFLEGLRLPCCSMSWRGALDWVTLLEILAAAGQSAQFISPAAGGQFADTPLRPWYGWFEVMTALTLFFILDMVFRILILGPGRYWHRAPERDRFDCVSNSLLFAMEVSAYVYSHCCVKAPDELVRTILTLHILRSVCLAHRVKPLRYLVALVVKLVPVYSRLGMVLLTTFYIFATVGEPLFGGLLYKGNPMLEGTLYAQSAYWPLNFNDFLSGCVTLFTLMIVNNWFVIARACVAVTSPYSSAFFVCFFVIINLIVLNILIALILESSQAVREELQKGIRMEDQQSLDEPEEVVEVVAGSRELLLQRMLMSEDHTRTYTSEEELGVLAGEEAQGSVYAKLDTTSTHSESGSTESSGGGDP